jgi:hypothetical protein
MGGGCALLHTHTGTPTLHLTPLSATPQQREHPPGGSRCRTVHSREPVHLVKRCCT